MFEQKDKFNTDRKYKDEDLRDGEIMEEIVRELRDLGDSDSRVREEAKSKLKEKGDFSIVDYLLEDLESDKPETRQRACIALGAWRDPRAINHLANMMEDKEQEVRIAALESMFQLHDNKALNPIIIALGNASKKVRRRASEMLKAWKIEFGHIVVDVLDRRPGAFELLMEIDDRRIIVPLLKARVSESMSLRWAAHEALSHLGEFALDHFLHALKSENKKIREQVTGYLGKMGDPKAIEPIKRLLEDDSLDVRKAAIIALGAMGDPDSLTLVKNSIEDSGLRMAAVEALGLFGGDEAFDILLGLMGREDLNIKIATTKSLSQLGDARAIEPILELEKIEKNPTIKDELHEIFEQLIRMNQAMTEDHDNIRCTYCFNDFTKFSIKYSFFKKYDYYACASCKRSHGIRNLDEVVAVLDKDMEESRKMRAGYLLVNWQMNHYPFVFNRLVLRNADEEMLDDFINNNISRNTDAFKEKLKTLKITVFSNCNISKRRIEELSKMFGPVEEVIEESEEESEYDESSDFLEDHSMDTNLLD